MIVHVRHGNSRAVRVLERCRDPRNVQMLCYRGGNISIPYQLSMFETKVLWLFGACDTPEIFWDLQKVSNCEVPQEKFEVSQKCICLMLRYRIIQQITFEFFSSCINLGQLSPLLYSTSKLTTLSPSALSILPFSFGASQVTYLSLKSTMQVGSKADMSTAY